MPETLDEDEALTLLRGITEGPNMLLAPAIQAMMTGVTAARQLTDDRVKICLTLQVRFENVETVVGIQSATLFAEF